MTIFWRRCLYTSLLTGLCCSAPGIAAEQAIQALPSIMAAAVTASKDRAKDHGFENVAVEVRPLDQRLRLAQCSQPLATFTPQTSQVLGAISVGIRCTAPKPWTIYVRTVVSAQKAIPVLARSLARNTVISEADIKLVSQPLQAQANGVIYNPEHIIGMELTRSLDAGSTVRVNQLRAPKVIKRGQQVTLVAGMNGLEVRIQGKAMKDAAEGEWVTVTALDTGKKIEGIAHSDGTVSVQ
jgi:flagella basal body P-ring formation protein FlgA